MMMWTCQNHVQISGYLDVVAIRLKRQGMNVSYNLKTGHSGGLCLGYRRDPLVPSCSLFVLQTFPRRPSVFDVKLPDVSDRKLNYSPRPDQIISSDRNPSPHIRCRPTLTFCPRSPHGNRPPPSRRFTTTSLRVFPVLCSILFILYSYVYILYFYRWL